MDLVNLIVRIGSRVQPKRHPKDDTPYYQSFFVSKAIAYLWREAPWLFGSCPPVPTPSLRDNMHEERKKRSRSHAATSSLSSEPPRQVVVLVCARVCCVVCCVLRVVLRVCARARVPVPEPPSKLTPDPLPPCCWG